jgi:hypothetical protein
MSLPDGGGVDDAVEALRKTQQCLVSIQRRLQPFLRRVVATEESETEAEERALVQAAVALSIATLRVMGHRLRGSDRGKAPDDPLRQELNRIRAALKAASDRCKAKKEERKIVSNRHPKRAPTSTDTAKAQSLEAPESALGISSSGKRKDSSSPAFDQEDEEQLWRPEATMSRRATVSPSLDTNGAPSPSKRRRRG